MTLEAIVAFIPVPDAVEVVLRFTWGGQVVAITLSFKGIAPATVTTLTAIAGAVITWWQTNMRALTVTGVTLNSVSATALDSASAPGIVVPVTTSNVGTAAGSSSSNNVTLATTFLTALRGRSYRGRNYFVGMSVNNLANSIQANASFGTALQAAYVALGTAAAAAGFDWVVVSRYTANAPRVTGVSTVVTGVQQELYIDSQRRRLFGRGL